MRSQPRGGSTPQDSERAAERAAQREGCAARGLRSEFCRALQEEAAAEEAAAEEPEAGKESEAHSRTSRKPVKLGGERTSELVSQHGRDLQDTNHLEFISPLGVRGMTMTGASRIGELMGPANARAAEGMLEGTEALPG